MVENQQSSLLGKIAAYVEILAADPLSTIFVSLSEAYRRMGMLQDAYKVANAGLEVLPDYCPGHVVLARIKCQQGDLVGSEQSFLKALRLDNDNLAALVGFARLNLLQGRRKDARDLLLQARALSPADSVINKLLLSLPDSEFQSDPAFTEVEDTVAPEVTDQKSSEPFESATLADLYRKQGLKEKALDIYRNLLLREPDNLEYRRCIRDLEMSMASSSERSEVVAATDVQRNEGPVERVDHEVMASVTDCQVEDALDPLVLTPSRGDSVLDQLNQLLTSIQKRRGDVQ